MSIDLHELFSEEGTHSPPSTLDIDYIVRRGRWVRARRRASVGATALVSAGVVAFAFVALVGAVPSLRGGPASGSALGATSSPAMASPAVTPTGGSTPWGAPPAALAAVSLPDPAPGFPVRRFPDSVQQESSGPGNQSRWVAVFALAEGPGGAASLPTGPQVSMFVGAYPKPVHLDGARPLPGTPEVAGVVGHLARYTEKGTTFRCLYFTPGKFTVEIIGSHVTTAQLVALGGALTGLQ